MILGGGRFAVVVGLGCGGGGGSAGNESLTIGCNLTFLVGTNSVIVSSLLRFWIAILKE